MITRIQIQKLDANIEEVTIGEWLKAEGERVEVGDPLVEIITDKATFELEAEVAGVLRQIVAPRNSVVPVGYIIGVIGDPEDDLPEVEAENQALLAVLAEQQKIEAVGPARPLGPLRSWRPSRVRATPAARRLAREHGLDLAQIPPSSGEGIIHEKDVEAYLRRREKD
ncbi:MAG TPA: hypothetical protein EYP85_14240 [Armatimonadetes bacterium]|nr:hypothetical protein [Armatimonadota bacterium]